MLSNCLIFHTSGGISSSPGAFLFLIFLMSNCLLMIIVIGLCVTSVGFLVDSQNAVSTVLFFLAGLWLSV